jgi:anaerobic selenocysteine-containing dehydrogenase
MDTQPSMQPAANQLNETHGNTPEMGGGLPVIEYWARHTLSPEGPKLWKTLFHKSACLSCAWGTGARRDRLGRLSFPVILRAGQSHYERISWDEI